MSFVGKILIVFQVVLSVIFMAFAGAVYTAHMNWRDYAGSQKKLLADKTREFNDKSTELETTKMALAAKLTAAEQKAAELDATRKGLAQDVERLKKESGDLQVARKTASEQSLIAGQDSKSRKTEADNLRALNHELTSKRDAEYNERIKLEDANHALEIALESAVQKNKDLLGRIALLQQALEANGISSDVTELATKNAPPPVVDGKITEIRRPKKQGSNELVAISLGSDDGLKRGHELTAFRASVPGSGQAKFLAQIRIVETTPDASVGEVIERSRNGVIQKGDNVTTKR
jgi:hypothetical protein